MKHIMYPSMTNHYQGKFIDKIKLEFPKEINEPTWVVTEKIHGSNYSFWVDYYTGQKAAYVNAAKRTGFIDKGEKFYNHQEVFNRLSFGAYSMAKQLDVDVAIFGELFGGSYGGVSKGIVIQKGTQYHPHNDFMCFDIARYKNGNPETLTFYDHDKVVELCEEFNIPHVPVLFEGTLQACLNFNNEFQTNVPKIYGLDDIAGNICEGIVIKPKKPLFLKSGERVILKSKNDKFSETTKVPKIKAIASVFTESVLNVIEKITSGLTENRMDAIVSKHGVDIEFGAAMKELFLDSYNEHCKEEYEALSKDEQSLVHKALQKPVADIVKRKINLKKKAG